ncbi:MAG: MATE family efflux transporter, partial [Acidimicrobiales bacterium]
MRTRLGRLDALDRRILAIAVPALGSLLVEPVYVLTDTAVVGRLGTVPLGGLALASTVLNTLVWVFNFLSYGTTVRVAVRRGRGDPAGAATDALQALWLAVGIGTLVAVGIGLGASRLVALLGHDTAVVAQGVTYLRVSVVGVPFQFVTIACIGYLYGLPDTKRPFAVLAVATSANLALELLLVFGLDWGISGSAWGTVFAQILSATVFLAIVVPSLRADGLRHLSVVPSVMWAVVKVGAHLVQRTAFLLATLAVATAAASRVGIAQLAGHQIAAQLFL